MEDTTGLHNNTSQPEKQFYVDFLSKFFGGDDAQNEMNLSSLNHADNIAQSDFACHLNMKGGDKSQKENKNMLRYKKKPTTKKYGGLSSMLDMNSDSYYQNDLKPTRKVSKLPFKVLDAPQLQDDFYLNLVDWSSQNVLAVGLGTEVYIWSA